MKLLLPFSTFFVILFSMGCECQNNYYGEPTLTFFYGRDSTIEIYDIDQNNRFVGVVNDDERDYALNLNAQSTRLLLKYNSGISDTLVLNYTNEVKYTNECNYFIESNNTGYTFTKNNYINSVQFTRNNKKEFQQGFIVLLYE